MTEPTPSHPREIDVLMKAMFKFNPCPTTIWNHWLQNMFWYSYAATAYRPWNFQPSTPGTLENIPMWLNKPELISNCWAVTAKVFIAPGNDRSISQNRSKCHMGGLNLLYAPELISNCWAVTTTVLIAPGNHWPIRQNCSKCPLCSLNLLHTF